MPGMFVQAIYDLELNVMGRGRVANIGDAGSVARPHCGAGVSKAADDAANLATALSAHDRVEDAINLFSAERTKAGQAAARGRRTLGLISRWTSLSIGAQTFHPTGLQLARSTLFNNR